MLVFLSGCVGPDDEFEVDDVDTEIYADTDVDEFQVSEEMMEWNTNQILMKKYVPL